MISRKQYIEILDLCEAYVTKYNEIFKKNISDEYAAGMECVLDLIGGLVDKNK